MNKQHQLSSRIAYSLIVLSCLIYLNANSQVENKKIDSLKKQLTFKKSETAYIDNLNNLAQQYWFINLDSARTYADKAFKQSKKNNYKKGTSHALKNLGVSYYYTHNFKDALPYLKQSLNIYQDIGDSKGAVSCIINIANIKRSQGKEHEAYFDYIKALEIIQKLDDKRLLAIINLNLGQTLMDLDRYEEALAYIQTAAKVAEEINEQIILANCYHFMGRIYVNLNIVDDAILYYNKSINLYNRMGTIYNALFVSLDLAQDLISLKKFDKAETIIKEILKKVKTTEFKDVLQSVLTTYGILQIEKKQYYQAINNLLHSYTIANEIDNVLDKPKILIELSRVYYYTSNFKKAMYYLNMVKELNISSLTDLSSYHLLLHDIHKKNNNFKEALYHFEIHKQYQDSIFIVNKEKTVAEMKIKYHTEAKEKENDILIKNAQINTLTIHKQKTSRNLFITLTIIVALLALFLLYRYNIKRKSAKVLEEKNQIITQQKDSLDIANQTKTKLFSIISHDLINPFNTIIGYTDLLANDYDSFNEKERHDIIAAINKSSTVNYNLVKNLLDWSRTQQHRISVNKEAYPIKNLIDHAIAPYMLYAQSKAIEIIFNLSVNNIIIDSNLFKTTIANLFFNAIKFSNVNGKIIMASFINEDKKTVVSIQDFGIGMTQEQVKTLFNPNLVTNSLKGTQGEKGSGLGLMVCFEFIQLLEGNIQITSRKGEGTTITLVL